MKPALFLILSFLSGALFAVGLGVGGMLNPENIQNFLLFGSDRWQPGLLFVMGSAIAVYSLAFIWMSRRKKTLVGNPYSPPHHGRIDRKLVLGALLFGIGWGIYGLCPGPAITRLFLWEANSLGFLAAMFLGFFISSRWV